MQALSGALLLFGRSLRGRTISILTGLCVSATIISGTGCLSRSLTGLTIQPSTGNTKVLPGISAQFRAIGTYTMSGHQTTTQDLTDQVQWSTVIPAVATINSSGLATGVGVGYTSIIATIHGSFGQLSAVSNITVDSPTGSSGGGATARALNTVAVVPTSQTLSGSGATADLLAIGTYNVSPTSANLTSSAAWRSSDPAVAIVNSAGIVTAQGAGTATITALATSPDGSVVQGSGTITVSGATATGTRTVTGIAVSPGSQTLSASGQTANLLALGTFTASPTTQDVTSNVTWQSSDTSVATVSSGVVTATGPGAATITAVYTGADGTVVTGTATVTVNSAAPATRSLTSLTLIPVSQPTTQIGETSQYLAIGTYSSAPLTADLTNNVTWVSSDTLVATVNNAGLATTVGLGTASITALAPNTNGSILTATATLTATTAAGTVTLPTLGIYGAGLGSGTVTGTVTAPGGSSATPISCTYTGPSTALGVGTLTSGCTGSFTLGSTVTLTATPSSGSVFGGWSSNCTTSSPTTCTITLNGNDSVGAIFDN